MLAIPTCGVARSAEKHNSKLDVICDWVEASVVLGVNNELSQTDVVDALCDNEIYASQDFAWAFIPQIWRELKRRANCLGSCAPVTVERTRLERVRTWKESLPHGFCLVAAYGVWNPAWGRRFGPDYTRQGELFERITQEALGGLLPEWEVYSTGWSRTATSKLNDIVAEVATKLREVPRPMQPWVKSTAKDAGLDLLCYRAFTDGRGGRPVYLIQCASGADWDEKVHTPDLRVWEKIVDFTAKPLRGFAMPFALADDDFCSSCNKVGGLFLDRYRLLSAGCSIPEWPSRRLKADIAAWLKPRIRALPCDVD